MEYEERRKKVEVEIEAKVSKEIPKRYKFAGKPALCSKFGIWVNLKAKSHHSPRNRLLMFCFTSSYGRVEEKLHFFLSVNT